MYERKESLKIYREREKEIKIKLKKIYKFKFDDILQSFFRALDVPIDEKSGESLELKKCILADDRRFFYSFQVKYTKTLTSTTGPMLFLRLVEYAFSSKTFIKGKD